MVALSQRREERLVAEVKRLSHAGLDGVSLLQRTARAVQKTIPFAAYCGGTTDPVSNLLTRGLAEGLDDIPIDDAAAEAFGRTYFERVYFEEELDRIAALKRAGTSAISLYALTDGKPERSLRYRALLQPSGLGDEVGLLFDDRGMWGGLDLMRARRAPPFSPREVALLRTIVPHVAAGLKSAALRARAAEPVGSATPGVLVIDERGAIVSATAAARAFLAELEPDGPGWQERPTAPISVHMVLGALRRSLQPATDADMRSLPRLRARTRGGRWLTLHADLTEPAADRPSERVVVIAPAQPEEIAWLSLAGYQLSPREEEVVKLVVAGLSTRQIGDRLFIAEHTVQRHLSNVFEKAGVRSRRDLVKQLFFTQVLPNATTD